MNNAVNDRITKARCAWGSNKKYHNRQLRNWRKSKNKRTKRTHKKHIDIWIKRMGVNIKQLTEIQPFYSGRIRYVIYGRYTNQENGNRRGDTKQIHNTHNSRYT